MGKLKLRGKDLRKLGYSESLSVGVAMRVLHKHYKRSSHEDALTLLSSILAAPEDYSGDPVLGDIARTMIAPKERPYEVFDFVDAPNDYRVFGRKGIERGAIDQMDVAMQLPITRAGALMPDAHQGYGLPIGGVLAAENAVIPYGVGVDIGCRMCLSMYDLPQTFLDRNTNQLKRLLTENTRFGINVFDTPKDHDVLDRSEFQEIDVVRKLKDKAWRQIGSSGGGNHFVEFGTVELTDPKNEFGLPAGTYVAVLSHSGSRGLGANIAQHFTRLAKDRIRLPRNAGHLAWLDLSTEAGQEYWAAMNLAGDYASACHQQIHERLSRALGQDPLAMVENHHNFAWKETGPNGTEWIVHRKGATPAKKGELGIIPGSMTAPGYIVRGKGDSTALNSASHGAGRVMSRSRAKASYTKSYMQDVLKKHRITLIGGGVDEAPMVYKDIKQVMEQQKDLVEVLGTFHPRIVRMAKD